MSIGRRVTGNAASLPTDGTQITMKCVAKEKRSAFVPTMNLLGVPQNCLSKLDGFRIMGFGGTTEAHIRIYLNLYVLPSKQYIRDASYPNTTKHAVS